MKKFLSLVLVALLVLALTPAFAEGDSIYIGVVYKQSGNAYFQASVDGIQKAADELGFTFEHDGPDDGSNDGPDDGSSDGQIRIIENYIAQGVDALCVSANDPAALVDVLQEAMEEGIYVISWDAPVNAEGRTLDVEPASAQTIALTQLESLAKSINYEGQVAIVSAAATMPNQNLWIQYIEEELAANEAYKNIEYIGTVYGDDEYQKSFDETQALLNKYPDLKGIMGTSSFDAPGVARAIEELGLTGKVFTSGTGMPADNAELLKSGAVQSLTLWDPALAGQAMIALAEKLLAGEEITTPLDLGVEGYTALQFREGSETVLEGEGWMVITAENVDSLGF